MNNCILDHTENKNNGLITKIWGKPGWIFTHAITFGYPDNPSETQKRQYKNFFISLGNVLPCKFCRESYQKFITTGNTELTDKVLENRASLTLWYYNVHQKVNDKLEIDYMTTYEDVINQYESFRARCDMKDPDIKGCTTPLDYKAFSYRKLRQIECPIIAFYDALFFYKLAIKRNLPKENFIFFKLIIKMQGNISKLKYHKIWLIRNKLCKKQIRFMRENAKESIEKDGKWINLPTIEELKLILLLCSNLNRSEINKCKCNLSDINL